MIVLFDQFVKTFGEENKREKNFYIRLGIEDSSEVNMPLYVVEDVNIEEKFGKGYVECDISLRDKAGAVLNSKPIQGNYNFFLWIGKSRENYREYTLKLNKVKFDNMSLGEMDDFRITLKLISSYWEDMISKRSVKAWRNSTCSDVVQNILDEVGIQDSFVEQTTKQKERLVFPYFTNHEILDYIKHDFKPETNDSFYICGPTHDGFIFSSFDKLIDKPLEGIFEREPQDPRRFRVSGDIISEFENKKDDALKVQDFRVIHPFVETMRSGASGIQSGFYSFIGDTYQTFSKTFADSDERQLSDWSFIPSDQVSADHFVFDERSQSNEDDVVKELSRKNNNMQNVIIAITGTTDIHIGELVDVLIPINPLYFEDLKYNEFYNGKYIVTGRKTVIDMQTSFARTVFSLSRQGINGIALDGLEDSSTGKVV